MQVELILGGDQHQKKVRREGARKRFGCQKRVLPAHKKIPYTVFKHFPHFMLHSLNQIRDILID